MPRESPHGLVTRLEETIRPLEVEFHHAFWDSQVDATPQTERRRAELEVELRRIKGDPESLEAITDALEGSAHDSLLRRELELLRLTTLGNLMDEERRAEIVELSTSIEADFATYRAELDGKRVTDNDIEEILKSSEDQELRRNAWLASKRIGQVVAERVRELARLRNSAAHDLGFADFYSMSLELQEISEEWLFQVLDDVERMTDEPFKRWKAELDAKLSARFGTDELRPWHYADPFFQSLPPDARVPLDEVLGDASAAELAVKTFSGWNIDLSGVMEASDLYPRERKSQHAFCMDIDRSSTDVRILANVVPGERWVEVMLHESGHAAYDVSVNPRLPYLLRRAAHTFVTEAVAILSGRLVRDPDWLTTIAGVSESQVQTVEPRLRSATATASLLFARWAMAVTHFERDLYLDPEGDLDARWWELVERFQLIAAPPGRAAPDWAAKIHISAAPAYYHNYLLGEMLASQLEATFAEAWGGIVGVPQVGETLVQRVFHAGASLKWDEVTQQATGRPLSASDFAEAISRT
jgi:peptidyl-dipeptidase A